VARHSSTKAGQRASGKRLRDIRTPEGVILKVELASPWDRAAAVFLDLLVMTLVVIGVALLFYFSSFFTVAPSAAYAIGMILFFLLRNFYFLVFELRWRGVTPGKRVLGLRVMNRSGGPLQSDAIFARNLLREIEMFIPITFLLTANLHGAENLSQTFALIWLSLFVLLPFFNKDKMRAGDMVGGTWVVYTPKGTLLEDVAVAGKKPKGTFSAVQKDTIASPAITFTDAQLDIYGIYELQTLENVLRVGGPSEAATQKEVCARIQKKIGWPKGGTPIEPKPFLEAFYAALRARLEARMLLGVRKENKYDDVDQKK
jgi:uncharacterized RDD family membrane protein YckC